MGSEKKKQGFSLKFNDEYPILRPLWVSVFTDILGFTIILPFLPLLARDFATSDLLLGLLIASNAIFGFFFSPILGKLSDKYGRRPWILISQLGTIAGFLVLAFSNSLWMLFLARIIDGMFGGQFPISKAIIGDAVEPKDRGKQMTNIGVAFTLASLIGPALGGFLSNAFGIIGPGLAASIIAIFTFSYTYLKLPETLPEIVGRPAWALKYEQKIVNPQKPIESIWKNEKALYVLFMYLFLALAATVFQSTFSLFGNMRLNLDAAMIGILFSSMGLFQVFFRFLFFNRIRDKLGDTKTALIGLINFIPAYALLGIVTNFYSMMLVLFYISIGNSMARGIVNSFASRTVDHRNQGKIMGLTTSIDNFSQIIGPIFGTMILSNPNPWAYVGLLIILSVIAFVLSLRFPSFGFEKPDH